MTADRATLRAALDALVSSAHVAVDGNGDGLLVVGLDELEAARAALAAPRPERETRCETCRYLQLNADESERLHARLHREDEATHPAPAWPSAVDGSATCPCCHQPFLAALAATDAEAVK